jgi:Chitobiase/beta-hexosaminidase C-terminal domain/SdrD B-like domain
MSSTTRFVHALLALSALTLISGCSGISPVATSVATPSLALRGIVHGGQQAVVGATIQLYAIGTTGDASAGAPLGSSATTAGDGSFSLTGKYNCASAVNGVNTLVYLVSTGGNPGSGTNPNLAMMAALGPCSSLTSSTFIYIDEVTTIGSIAALTPYMSSYTNVGSNSGDAAAFATAFGNVAEYTNTSTGTAPGPSLPGGYYASSTEIDTLGNIIAACVNSTGGSAIGANSSDGSACGNLFNLTRSAGVAPTNTIGAVLNILNNPTQNATALFNLPQPVVPFQPVDSTAPSTWALSILPIAATPTFSVAAGTYSSAQFVTLSDTTSGAVIHYTTDGSTPTSASPIYSSTITVSSSQTIKAMVQAGGYATSAVASAAYTITGSTSTYNVNGQIIIPNCGVGSIPPITVTLNHGGVIVQTTTTNTSGNYSFSGVPNGSYTVTPSIVGPSSVFYPTTLTPTVNGSSLTIPLFQANLGYTVSGTVAYSGAQTGRTYLSLNPTSCGGGGTVGTSISNKGAFTIRGVPPGGYTMQAFMDNLGIGAQNASNPAGSTAVSVVSSNLTNQNVTLVDPASPVTITSAPTIQGASGFNAGAVALYKAITSNGIEQPTSYTLQWSTDPAFGFITGTKTFAANGTKADAWFFTGLTNGTNLYFRASGSSAGTAVGPYSSIYGPVLIGAPTGGNTVTGSVSFSQTPTGPLYMGFLSQTNNNFYAEYFPSPASAQAYSIQVPSDTYNFFAILDQNGDGLIDAGDIQDATDNGATNNQSTVISGPTSNQNLTLPSANGIATVQTQYYNSISPSGSSQGYGLNFKIAGLVKPIVAITLTSGPNLINPVDIAACASGCGNGSQIYFSLGTTAPNVGDSYTFSVTYSDGTTATLTATVTAVLNAFATSLAPQTGTSTSVTPTFSWTDPANSGNYIYSFSLCCSNNSDIWDIPGQNSNANGFSNSISSIPWNTDPTGGGSTPSVGSLTLGTVYTWTVQVQDSNGNSDSTQVQYQP